MCENMTPKFPKLQGKLAEKGITDERLGVQLGLSPSQMSRRLNGSVEFDLGEIKMILEFLDCTFHEVF